MSAAPVEAQALPRVGLLGNPSDLYGGSVLAFTFDQFRARVRIEPGERIELAPGAAGELALSDWGALEHLDPRSATGGVRLLAAALRRFRSRVRLDVAADDPRGRFRMGFATSVPRQAGLAGSSAIVIAALRALAAWFGDELDTFAQSELALAAEAEELGTTAGPQDRVAQAYGGLLLMDFSGPRRPDAYRRLDPGLLPPLLVAWDPIPGRDSGDVHAEVRRRWEAGDAAVRGAVARLSALAAEGHERLLAADHGGLRALVDENFDLRASVFPISERDRAMVELGRGAGAAAKLCGSGGAAVCVLGDGGARAPLERAFAEAGFRTVAPTVTRSPAR